MVLVVTHVGVLVVVFDVALAAVLIVIGVPCVVVVFVGIPLSIACETMYAIVVVEVSVGVVVAHFVVVTNVVGTQCVAQGIFGIPTII